MQEINVIVVDRGRKYLYLRYTDPVTGQRIEKSARTAKKKEAMKRAGEWQAELENGIAGQSAKLRWSDFRDAYEDHVDATLSVNTYNLTVTSFNSVERTMHPDHIGRITTKWISRYHHSLLSAGKSAATVLSYCRNLKAGLNWAKRQGWLREVPEFPKLKKAKSAKVMKGRPITEEEFERMLKAVEKLPEREHESLRYLLRGLWVSGLRLGEALSLTWDQWADGIRIDATEKYLVLLIPSDGEKGGQDRTYPVTPDFEEFLLNTPEDQRVGHVFSPVLYRGVCRRVDTVSKAISKIGRLARVKVDEKNGGVVYASAHDLRRSFGYRWARKVMPMVLKELMRHESVKTTEEFYVGIEAQKTAEFLRQVTLEVTPKKKGSQQSAETQ